MTKRDLPPLRALKAFEAFARLGSLSSAARELGVTGWAVSYQVKSLEQKLGVQLLRRDTKRAELTKSGKAYFPSVRDAFDLVEAQTRAIKATLIMSSTVDSSLGHHDVLFHDLLDGTKDRLPP